MKIWAEPFNKTPVTIIPLTNHMSDRKFSFILLVLLVLGLAPKMTWADSPLTSTPFYKAYFETEKMVRYAKDNPILDKKIAKFLMKESNPLHLKAAVINAMGWDVDGKNNAEILLAYLVEKRKIGNDEQEFEKLTPHDLFCMGYTMALDNYFDVEDAASVLALAGAKMPGNFTAQFIHALVMAQIAMDVDWCDVWKLVSSVEQNKTLKREMLPAAIAIVMEYIGLYRDDCTK